MQQQQLFSMHTFNEDLLNEGSSGSTTLITNDNNNNNSTSNSPHQQQQQTERKLEKKRRLSNETRSTLLQLGAIFVVFVILLICIFLSLPSFENNDELSKIMTIPRSLKHVRDMAHILSVYTQHSYLRVMFAIFCLYIFLQTFSVPGTIFLNVLCGALFGLPVGFFMTLIGGTLGASCAYLLSKLLGGSIIKRYFPDKLNLFRNQVSKHKNNLFYFMLFLRISPMLPNWFINISSPLIHVPFLYFFAATLVGIAPQTAISVNIGNNIFELVDDDVNGNPLVNKSTILTLFGIALLALIPVYLKRNKSLPSPASSPESPVSATTGGTDHGSKKIVD
jgi:uncharacterized membrane protein YdjX (TVP38/TMEM64 family)